MLHEFLLGLVARRDALVEHLQLVLQQIEDVLGVRDLLR